MLPLNPHCQRKIGYLTVDVLPMFAVIGLCFSTFVPAKSSTISGIAGNAPILGYGRVELEDITLNNVAYIRLCRLI